jgi:iron(II)-dependent oxidoreductase
MTTAQLIVELQEARARQLDLIADLDEEQMIGPRLAIVNPLRWEIGHVAHFQEFWLLRRLRGRDPISPAPNLDPDKLYDSARVAHDTRWDLPLPSKQDTIAYTQRILDDVLDAVRRRPHADDVYFLWLSLLHEDMHNEAITYTRQTLGVRSPGFSRNVPDPIVPAEAGTTNEDIFIPGGAFNLGSERGAGFVFDNEQWAHEVTVAPFHLARTAVTQAEFAAFVNDGGYQRPALWSEAGWNWREDEQAQHPVYWKSDGAGNWQRRAFDRWLPLEADLPVLHINWHEAEAYCRWANRRLPTEAEWEWAASGKPGSTRKRTYAWGDGAPSPDRANLDWRAGGAISVHALPAGDSAFGVRQMIGNVWEWTATDFEPYPGFAPGPYKEYSAPWFGDHKVLRGGCWATRTRLIRNAYRNFYKPDRRDVWAGFRTCAL